MNTRAVAPVLIAACFATGGAIEPRLIAAADLTRRVSLNLADRPLRELLAAIADQCDLEVLADRAIVDRPIAVVADQTPAWRVLGAAAQQTSIFWWPDHGALLISAVGTGSGKGEPGGRLSSGRLAAQAMVALIASLADRQRAVLLRGDVLAWTSLTKPQAELILTTVRNLHPDRMPWSIGVDVKGLSHGLALVFDPYVEYRITGRRPVRAFFRAHRAVKSLMTVRPLKESGAFTPVAPSRRNAAAPPKRPPPSRRDAAPPPKRPPATAERSFADLCQEAFPGQAAPVPLPPLGSRVITAINLRRGHDAQWLFERARNCLGARERAYGDAKVLSAPSFALRRGRERELELPPMVGVPGRAVTEALKPFMARVDLKAEGYPFSTAHVLANPQLDAEGVRGKRLRFLLEQLPQKHRRQFLDPKTGRIKPSEIRLGSSVVLAIFAYGEDRLTRHPLRSHWTCLLQVQLDYGESLPQVLTKRGYEL